MRKPVLAALFLPVALLQPPVFAQPAPGTPAASPPGTPAAEAAGAKQEPADPKAFLESFLAIDLTAQLPEALNRMSDDVFVYDEGLDGQPVRLEGKEAVRKHLQQRVQELGTGQSRLTDVVVRTAGDAAWIGATWNHVIPAGEDQPAPEEWKQIVTFFLRKNGAAWKLGGWHASPAEVPEEAFEGDPEEMMEGDPEEEYPGEAAPEAMATPRTRPAAEPTAPGPRR